MTKVFDILLDPYHGSQMLRVQLQIGLQKSSRDYKNSFPKISEKNRKKRSTELENGMWNQNPSYVVKIWNLDIWRYYHWNAAALTWTCKYYSNGRRHCVLRCWFYCQKCIKIIYLCCLWWYPWRKLCFINQYWSCDPKKNVSFLWMR